VLKGKPKHKNGPRLSAWARAAIFSSSSFLYLSFTGNLEGNDENEKANRNVARTDDSKHAKQYH
jgi:hypothetical protein